MPRRLAARRQEIVFYSLTQAGSFLYAQVTVGAIRDLVAGTEEHA